jgi:hypothetical protein
MTSMSDGILLVCKFPMFVMQAIVSYVRELLNDHKYTHPLIATVT